MDAPPVKIPVPSAESDMNTPQLLKRRWKPFGYSKWVLRKLGEKCYI
jgi:hypothetical protein